MIYNNSSIDFVAFAYIWIIQFIVIIFKDLFIYICKRSSTKIARPDCNRGAICSISSSKQDSWSSLKRFWFVSFIYNLKQRGWYLASNVESHSKPPPIFLFSAVSFFSSHLFFKFCKTFPYCIKASLVSFLRFFCSQKKQTEGRSWSSPHNQVLLNGSSVYKWGDQLKTTKQQIRNFTI